MLELPFASAHLWCVRTGAVTDALLADYARLLSCEETERHERIVRPERRRELLVARALVRTTLSRYAPVAPEAWELVPDTRGKPEVRGPAAGIDLRFSLTHTRGLVACVVARGIEVGVDAESLARRPALRLAQRFFAPGEAAAVLGAAPEQQQRRFLEIWTLKEAYLKARGLGLSLPLASFAFALGPEPTVAFDARADDDPAAWSFRFASLSAEHVVAVAVRDGSARLTARAVVPLASGA